MSDFYIEYAAHKGHGLLHTSDEARVGLGLAAFAIATTIILVTTAELTIPVVIAAAATGAEWGAVGEFVGGFVDPTLPKERDCEIVSGHESVRLGPACAPAARADPDTRIGKPHDGDVMIEGSLTVSIGTRPMSRHRDQASCGGQVSEGLTSVLVGGLPSGQGAVVSEKPSEALTQLHAFFAVISATKAVSTAVQAGSEVTLAQLLGAMNKTATATGHGLGPWGSIAVASANQDLGALVGASLAALGEGDAANVWGAGQTLYGLTQNGAPTALSGIQATQSLLTGVESLDNLFEP